MAGRLHIYAQCPKCLNFNFMRQMVGEPALRFVTVFPDGSMKGFMLTSHLEAIVKAYVRRTDRCRIDIEENDLGGNTLLTYFELGPSEVYGN